MNSRVLLFFLTFFLLITTTTVVFLWMKGYTIDQKTKKLEKVGMISVKSVPDGARIYLNDSLTSATNTTLSNLKGGDYRLKVEKEGFAAYEKTVPVKEEYVTALNIVLVPLSVEIKPLTGGGVISPVINNSKNKIYFLAKNPSDAANTVKSGVWLLDLNSSIFNLFKGGASLILPDTKTTAYSSASQIEISPNDSEMMIKMNDKGYYNFDLTALTQSPQATGSALPTYANWEAQETEKKKFLADKSKLSPGVAQKALEKSTVWSPDEKKFLYKVGNDKGDSWIYQVRNLSDPLGVGEKEDYTLLTVAKNSSLKFTWYPDSNHLLTSECSSYKEEGDKTKDGPEAGTGCRSGSIHLIDIDGTNNTQIFSGSMSSNSVFPTPDGSQIIILTTFNQSSPPNLYAISLR